MSSPRTTSWVLAVLMLMLFGASTVSAQLPKIRLTDNLNGVTWNEMLPSGRDFLITGKLPEDVGSVEVKIYRGGTMRTAAPIHVAEWTKPRRKETDEFAIHVKYSLTPGVTYDLEFRTFRKPNEEDLDDMLASQKGKITGYIKAASQSAKYKGLDQRLKTPKKRVKELNNIYLEALANIKGVEPSEFKGYSKEVKDGFSQMNFFARMYQEQLGYGDLFKPLVEQAEYMLNDHTRYLTELALGESEHFLWRRMMVANKSTSIERHKAAEMVIAGSLPKATKVKKQKQPKPPKVKKPKEPKVKEPKAPKEPKVKEPKEPKVKEPKAPKEPKVKEPKEPKVKEPKAPKEPKVKEPKEPKVKEPKAPKEPKEPKVHSDHPYWHGISLNPGIGGVMLSKFSDGRANASFGSRSFVGFSFPFAGPSGEKKFLRKTSITFGAFLSDIPDEDDEVYSGSIFRTPVYIALGHRTFKVLRFHIGTSILKTPPDVAERTTMIVRPMAGFSLDLNWELFERIARDF